MQIKPIKTRFYKSNHKYIVDKQYQHLPLFTASSLANLFIEETIDKNIKPLLDSYLHVAGSLGTGVHEALETWLKTVKNANKTDYGVERYVIEKYSNECRMFYMLGKTIMDNYTTYQVQASQLECKVSYVINSKYVLCGKYDMLIPKPYGCILVDFKTTVLKELTNDDLATILDIATKVVLDDLYHTLKGKTELDRKIILVTRYLIQMSVYWLGIVTGKQTRGVNCDCNILWSNGYIMKISNDSLQKIAEAVNKKMENYV